MQQAIPNDILKELKQQQQLLKIEYEAEKSSFHELTNRIGITRLVSRGAAWYPVRRGKFFYNSLNQPALEILHDNTDEDNADFADHLFEHGKAITFFTLAGDPGAKPHLSGSATVSFVDGNRMVVILPDGSQADYGGSSGKTQTGVMLSFDDTTYKAMFDALSRTVNATGRFAELRDLLFSKRISPQFRQTSAPASGYLNPGQQKGVDLVVRAKDVAVVHGPPGTGKTTTLVEAIFETLRRESQTLVCAQSNMAVDWIAEKLIDRGISVLRIGNPSRVNDKMLSFTYERRFEDHPDYPELWNIRRSIRQLRSNGRRSCEQWHQKLDRLQSRATNLELRIHNDLFLQARVIACTLVGSSSHLLDGMKFPTLFIDEAAQALEAASLIAIRRAGRVILAGDHHQLPPTVKSLDAARGGLGRSLMERVVAYHPEVVTLLTRQYRMNRAIMEFPNRWFYNGQMEADSSVEYRGILDYDSAIDWIDTSELGADELSDVDLYTESLAGDRFGRVNRGEAEVTIEAVEAYVQRLGVNRILDEQIDFGIISPYRAQVHYLRRLVKQSAILRPVKRLLSVNTIDGFQGQERDVIVISLVRSNEDGQIGFLNDLRRMNVAITRARMKLILIGHSPTLTKHRFFRELKNMI